MAPVIALSWVAVSHAGWLAGERQAYLTIFDLIGSNAEEASDGQGQSDSATGEGLPYSSIRQEQVDCAQRAIRGDAFLLRAECAVGAAQVYPGPGIVNRGLNTLARRAVGGVAAVDIIREHWFLGVGYHQSVLPMGRMLSRDPFGINDMFERPENLWNRIGQIRNVWFRSAAEFGIPGVLLLGCVVAGLLSISGQIVWSGRLDPGAVDPVVWSAALWAAVHVVLAQTTPWLLPTSPSLAWIGVWVGVVLLGALASAPRVRAWGDPSGAGVHPDFQ
jgi:hypothetical protein